MKVDKHDTSRPQKHLVSHAAISLVELEHGKLCRYRLLHSDDSVTEYELISLSYAVALNNALRQN